MLTVGGAGNVNASNVISGAGGLTKQDAGTLTLSGNNTTTGPGRMVVIDGTLQVTGGNAVGDHNDIVALGLGSVFEFLSDETIGSFNGTDGIFQLNANMVTVAGDAFGIPCRDTGCRQRVFRFHPELSSAWRDPCATT